VRVEEVLLLDEAAHAGLGQLGGELHVVGERGGEELVGAAGVAQGHLLEVDAHQRVCPAADLQRVVAADGGVLVAVIAHHHRVVDEVWFAGLEDGEHRILDEVVGRHRRVDLQRDVGHGLPK
jgi:hypothetical protein